MIINIICFCTFYLGGLTIKHHVGTNLGFQAEYLIFEVWYFCIWYSRRGPAELLSEKATGSSYNAPVSLSCFAQPLLHGQTQNTWNYLRHFIWVLDFGACGGFQSGTLLMTTFKASMHRDCKWIIPENWNWLGFPFLLSQS